MVRIAVVGAGVGGVTFAQCLAQRCAEQLGKGTLQVVLLERRLTPDAPEGGALTLQGEGLEVLENLGLRQLLCRGLCDEEGTLCQLQVLRDALMSALLTKLDDQIETRFNVEIAAVRESADTVQVDHRPLLVFEGGQWVRNTDPTVNTDIFDFVVGADGNSSSSRVAKGIVGEEGAKAKEVPLLILQALVPSSDFTQLSDTRQQYLRQGMHGVIGKLLVGTAVGRTSPEVPTSHPSGLQVWEVCTVMLHFKDAMENFPDCPHWLEKMIEMAKLGRDEVLQSEALAIMERAGTSGRLHAWVPFQKGCLDRWWSPGQRLVALGDAAHLMLPTAGWGANCAMGDAQKLADTFAFFLDAGLLAGPLPANFLEDAGQQYETLRRERAVASITASLEEAKQILDARVLRALRS